MLISMITFIKINRSQIKKTKITIYKLTKKKKTKLSHFIQTLWYIHFHNSFNQLLYFGNTVEEKKENQSQKQKKNKRKNRGKIKGKNQHHAFRFLNNHKRHKNKNTDDSK